MFPLSFNVLPVQGKHWVCDTQMCPLDCLMPCLCRAITGRATLAPAQKYMPCSSFHALRV